MAIWLALLFLLGLPSLASAVTLQVTGGTLYSFPEDTDNCGGFGGKWGYTAGCATGTATVDYYPWNPWTPGRDAPLATTWSYNMAGADNYARVGALECYADGNPDDADGGDETCGTLTFTHHAPIVLPADWDRSIWFTATVPFTLTGFLVFSGGERFDLIGHGLLTWTDSLRNGSPAIRYGEYTILPPTTVPEPATSVLLAVGLVGLAGWRRLRAR